MTVFLLSFSLCSRTFAFSFASSNINLLQVSNKPVSEATGAVEAIDHSADSGEVSIFAGDLKIARSATEALKQQLTRNVELLSSLNALLYPQPGTSHSMEFSRCVSSFAKQLVRFVQ